MSARAADSRNTLPGFDVAKSTRPAAIGQERRDLLHRGARDERRLHRIAGQPIDLALVAGGDEHAAVALEREVVRRVFAELPHEIRRAVRHDAVHRARAQALCSARRRLRGRAGLRGGRGVGGNGDRHDFGRYRRNRLAPAAGSGCAGARSGGWRAAPGHRRGVDVALRVDAQRADFVVGRVEQDERFAGGIDLEDAARRFGARERAAARDRTPASSRAWPSCL